MMKSDEDKKQKKNSNVYTQKYVNNNKKHFNTAYSLEIKLIDHAKQNHEK